MHRLTTLSKVIILIGIIAIVMGITYKLGGFDSTKLNIAQITTHNPVPSTSDVIRISLDEWIGWKPIFDANGGLETKSGSIYDKLGLKVKISIIDDATQSSNALVSNSLDGAGYTINRYAFLYSKLIKANTRTKMVYITNYSNGGDGIIAKKEINSIEQLVDRKIAIPRFSEAQTLVEWLLARSSLTEEQIKNIRSNMVMFDNPEDAAKAFFAGKVDASATWQPFLSQAQDSTGSHILFSTKMATNIILDGIVFRESYLNANPEKIRKFIDGALSASSLYKQDMKTIKESMPLFTTETDDTIKSMTNDASLATYQNNMELLGSTGMILFKDMSTIWKNLGEEANPENANVVFDPSYIQYLSSKYINVASKDESNIKFTPEQRQQAQSQDNKSALLTERLTINYETNASAIKDESYAQLNKFAETAKVLNGVIIQIEGNTDSTGDLNQNIILSQKRAKSIAVYLQYQGVDSSRFVIVGNGQNKPIGDNNTDAGRSSNRRTDIYFKVVK